MNTEAIRTEIEKIVSDNRKKLRGARQYPVTRAVQAELEALGIFQFIPQWMNRGYVGLSDAKAVLAAAKQSKSSTAVFNAYGEGDDVETPESELHRLLNEQPESEPQTQTITVADGEEFEVEGITFFLRETQRGDVYLLVPGGYGQDYEGEYVEVDGDYKIRTLFESDELGPDDYGEFEVTITADDLAAARAYRAEYPEFVPDED